MSGQAAAVAAELERLLGADLVAVYLHGSLAPGSGGPHSDVDLLAVAERALAADERRELDAALTALSSHPRRIELHVLRLDDLRPWRHPAPYDHYWAESGVETGGFDRDLAAHVTVTRAIGRAIVGPPSAELLPEVPWPDFEDALRYDLEWCLSETRHPLYRTLSPARVWATLATHELHTKETGALWALERLPADLRPELERALRHYRADERGPFEQHEEAFAAYAAFIAERVGELPR